VHESCRNSPIASAPPPCSVAKIRSLLSCLHIVGPITAPAPATTAILYFIFSWNDFFYALILAGTVAQTAP
jgi:ABC-type glycerol-3-phosphate transport system permease component